MRRMHEIFADPRSIVPPSQRAGTDPDTPAVALVWLATS